MHDSVAREEKVNPVASEARVSGSQGAQGEPSQQSRKASNDRHAGGSALRRVLIRPWHLVLDFPRASVPAILAIVAAIVGILLLPAQSVAVTAKPLVTNVGIQTAPHVPTYLGFIARGDRLGQVVVGFQVAPRQKVKWKLDIAHNARDHFRWRNGFDRHYSPLPDGQLIQGEVVGPLVSYKALQNGYWSFSESGTILSYITSNRPIPGLVSIFVQTTGPDQFLSTSGYNVNTVLPALLDVPFSSSGQFLSEDIVHAAGFESITGGPRTENGSWWDWFQRGAIPQISASGVDDLARQKSENRAFDAAIAFGLSAAALAAFAVEGVGAVSEKRKRGPDKPNVMVPMPPEFPTGPHSADGSNE